MKQLVTMAAFRNALADPVEPENMRLLAGICWRILVILAFVVVASAFAYGYSRFTDATGAFDSYVPQMAQKEPFSRADLDASVSAFDSRALLYQKLSTTPLTDTDPSQ